MLRTDVDDSPQDQPPCIHGKRSSARSCTQSHLRPSRLILLDAAHLHTMDSYEVLVADTVRRADPLGRCNTCLKAPPAGTKLMKRGACLAAFYCSTQCQKAHWPRHK